MYSENSILYQIATEDHSLAFFLRRYARNWNQSLLELCTANNIKVEIFIDLLRIISDPKCDDKYSFQQFSTKELISFLERGHKYYLNTAFLEINQLIHQLESSKTQSLFLCNTWKSFIDFYHKKLKHHFEEEELIIFPMALEIADSKCYFNLNQITLRSDLLNDFLLNHDVEKNEFEDLRECLLKLPHQSENNEIGRLMRYISSLEKDLHLHDLLEDEILLPRLRENLKTRIAKFN